MGTPGRLLDHISRRTLKLATVETLVLDEADEMLNMGFLEDIESIINKFQKTAKRFYSLRQCQTILNVSVFNL